MPHHTVRFSLISKFLTTVVLLFHIFFTPSVHITRSLHFSTYRSPFILLSLGKSPSPLMYPVSAKVLLTITKLFHSRSCIHSSTTRRSVSLGTYVSWIGIYKVFVHILIKCFFTSPAILCSTDNLKLLKDHRFLF